MPKNLLPIQSGVGNVANAVTAGFVHSDFRDLTVYTEVIQDGMLDLIDAGKLSFASGTAFSPSPEGMARFFKDIDKYKKYMILRPQEISNSAEVIRRLGVIAMNTAIEVDIYGNVNSTHIAGTQMMNGIGGSGDFARNAYLTIFYTPSIGAGRGRPARQVPAPARQGDHRALRASRLPTSLARLLRARRREDEPRAHAASPR